MIRHIVVFRFDDTFTLDVEQAWADANRRLVGRVPGLTRIRVTRDLVREDLSWDVALEADFDSLDAVRAWSEHPAHLEVLAISKPHTIGLAVIDLPED